MTIDQIKVGTVGSKTKETNTKISYKIKRKNK